VSAGNLKSGIIPRILNPIVKYIYKHSYRIINEKEIKYYYGADHHDHRIYGIEKLSDQFHFLFNDHQINETIQKLYNTNNPAITLLAHHVFSKKGNQGSGGSWHRDSIGLS